MFEAYSSMVTQAAISIRLARSADASDVAAVHDAAWREAYWGIIPGRELERMVQRRGPDWWSRVIARGGRIAVLEFDDKVRGYASYGRNRLAVSPYRGEIFELYLAPEFQGLGFGRRLFDAARRDLIGHRMGGLIVWSLADNSRAVGFYRHLGGIKVREMEERFGGEVRQRFAFGWS
ncbi:N-acetyltransferase GCN5 [Alsobacter metallidurans]|uniref:N-acetyltransferase GCN5 n=1 Tax=Alsobacter metallidurans TaxID=340221 RepID=A0A917IAP8_9HYPH|nr:N-acetyltransferase GCN5 [Alsobacter metallidurans]